GSAIIVIAGIDGPGGQSPAAQLTVPQGVTTFSVSVGSGTGRLIAASNNPAVATAVVDPNGTLRITGLRAGRAGLRLTDAATNAVRHVGVRVRNADGGLPGIPDHVMIGSVSEDTPGDLALWRNFGSGATNTRVDLRYIYLNGGPFNGWYTWSGGAGSRAT